MSWMYISIHSYHTRTKLEVVLGEFVHLWCILELLLCIIVLRFLWFFILVLLVLLSVFWVSCVRRVHFYLLNLVSQYILKIHMTPVSWFTHSRFAVVPLLTCGLLSSPCVFKPLYSSCSGSAFALSFPGFSKWFEFWKNSYWYLFITHACLVSFFFLFSLDLKPYSYCSHAHTGSLFMGLWGYWCPLVNSFYKLFHNTKIHCQK